MPVSPILAAIAFFDQFDRPLTSAEAVRYAFGRATPTESLDVHGAIHTEGYWHLPGRESIVAERKRRYLLSQKKFARARRIAKWMSLVPTVRMVAICNSLGLANAKEDSDIDLFVVTSPGAVWITRFIVVSVLASLRMRPDGQTHRDRVCMSFFVDEDAMDLSRLRIDDDDMGFLYFVSTFLPVYDAGRAGNGVAERFFSSNGWVRERLPQWTPERASVRWAVPRRLWSLGSMGVLRRFEVVARRFQERLFPKEIREMMNRDTRVVVGDRVLKFHVHDRRAEQRERFRSTLALIGN